MGVTVYIDGWGYWFEKVEDLVELLDANCNDAGCDITKDGVIEYDDDKKEGGE